MKSKLQRECSLKTCENMWKRPDAEGHTWSDSIYVKRLAWANPQRQSGLAAARGWGAGGWGVNANGCRVSFWGDEMFWNLIVVLAAELGERTEVFTLKA